MSGENVEPLPRVETIGARRRHLGALRADLGPFSDLGPDQEKVFWDLMRDRDLLFMEFVAKVRALPNYEDIKGVQRSPRTAWVNEERVMRLVFKLVDGEPEVLTPQLMAKAWEHVLDAEHAYNERRNHVNHPPLHLVDVPVEPERGAANSKD